MLAIAYWILLRLIQSQLLKSYIQNAYLWGLITILGGIVSSFLVTNGSMLAGAIVIRRTMAMNNSNELEIIIFFSLIIISLFGSGFLLGWLQKLAFRRSRQRFPLAINCLRQAGSNRAQKSSIGQNNSVFTVHRADNNWKV